MQEMTTKISLPALRTNKILLIERDKPIINSFKKAMADNNIGVDHCTTIDELKKMFTRLNDYEVVLVDIEYKSILNEMIGMSDKPFYIMWANDNQCDSEIEECLNIGASLFMKKDKDMNKVVSLVKHIEKAYISNYI
jgi:DNA-binding NtrC family response regulator